MKGDPTIRQWGSGSVECHTSTRLLRIPLCPYDLPSRFMCRVSPNSQSSLVLNLIIVLLLGLSLIYSRSPFLVRNPSVCVTYSALYLQANWREAIQ